jgi:hypothetical protein
VSRATENFKLRVADPKYAASRIQQLKAGIIRAQTLLAIGDAQQASEVLKKIIDVSRQLREPASAADMKLLADDPSWKQAGIEMRSIFENKVKNKFGNPIDFIEAWSWFRAGWKERAAYDFRTKLTGDDGP